MNRYELFDQAFEGHLFLNLLYKAPDEQLRQLWNETPPDQRQHLFWLPKVVERPEDYIDCGFTKIPATERLSNARDVADYYQFRMAADFMKDMPSIFRRVLILADDDDMLDTLFLGTLGALSICMPGVHGSLFKEEVLTNLYIFLTGAAASGKGKIGLCRRLLDPINDRMAESKLIIPANSSDTALYEEIANNGGRGIIFESEADTLTQAFKKGSGKFSDGLRCAFHNEPITYQRRTGKEKVYVNHPVLSMVLTGTPGQVPLLLQSPENGLFSRILFYRLTGENESFSEELSAANHITGEMINDYMLSLGEEVRRFYLRIVRVGGISFRFSEAQHERFLAHFHDITIVYKDLVSNAYEHIAAVDHIDSVMRRLGNICYRMMMILSVSRLMDVPEDEPLPTEVECDEYDFHRVIMLSEMLFHHTLIHYDELMVAMGVVPEVDDEVDIDEESEDSMNELQRNLFAGLPKRFTTQLAIQTAKQFGISARSTARYLVFYCELGILKCLHKGLYEKDTQSVTGNITANSKE